MFTRIPPGVITRHWLSIQPDMSVVSIGVMKSNPGSVGEDWTETYLDRYFHSRKTKW